MSEEHEQNLLNLANENLVKESHEIIETKFPPDSHFNPFISIMIFASMEREPKYMRILNQNTAGDASVKLVNVLYGNELIYAGEVPRSLGVNFDFTMHNEENINDIENPNLEEQLTQLSSDSDLASVISSSSSIIINFFSSILSIIKVIPSPLKKHTISH